MEALTQPTKVDSSVQGLEVHGFCLMCDCHAIPLCSVHPRLFKKVPPNQIVSTNTADKSCKSITAVRSKLL